MPTERMLITVTLLSEALAPPPLPVAELLLKVLLLTVSRALTLAMPPPPNWVAALPLTVLLLTISVPPPL